MSKTPADHWNLFLATGFYSGYSPFASGTAGTAVAVLIMIGLSLTLPIQAVVPVFIGLALLTTLGGIPIATRAEGILKKKDAGPIVIDEFAGTFISLAPFPFSFKKEDVLIYVLGFFLFRLFDVIKPFGIRSLQKYPGGLGIMIDDVAAGLLTLGLLLSAKFLVFPHLTF